MSDVDIGGPVQIGPSEEVIEEMVSYLQDELGMAKTELEEKVRKYQKWRRQADGVPEHEVRSWPWPGASNLEIPITGIMHNAVMGFFKKMFGNLNPFWTCKPYKETPEEVKKTEVLTKYLNILTSSPQDLNLKKKTRIITSEFSLLGVGTARIDFKNEKVKVRKASAGGVAEDVSFVEKMGPAIEPIPAEDFHYRVGYADIQTAPWISYTIHLPWHVLKNRGADGMYHNVDAVKDYAKTHVEEFVQDTNERTYDNPVSSVIWDIEIAYLFWDVDGDGTYEDMIITYEPKSGTVLGLEYNSLGRRPFVDFVYKERPFYRDGSGLGQMCERLQDGITATMNLTMDNAFFSGMRMLAVSNTGTLKGNEKIYPGKIWRVEDASKDIRPLQAGDVYTSGYQNINMLNGFAQQITSMNDIMHGSSSQTMKSADGVQSQMLRLQQSTGMVDAIADAVIDAFSEMGLIIFMTLVQNKDAVIEMETKRERLTKEELEILIECLEVPLEKIPITLSFAVRTSKLDETFEAKRQNYLLMSQLLTMFYKEMIPIYAQISDPNSQMPEQLKMFLTKVYTSSSKLLEEIFSGLGNDDPKKYVPDYERMDFLYNMVEQMKNAQFEQFKEQAKQGGPNGQQLPGAPNAPAGNVDQGVGSPTRPYGGAE